MSVSYQFTVGGTGVNVDALLPQAMGVSGTQGSVSGATAAPQAQSVGSVFQFNDTTQSQYLPFVVGSLL